MVQQTQELARQGVRHSQVMALAGALDSNGPQLGLRLIVQSFCQCTNVLRSPPINDARKVPTDSLITPLLIHKNARIFAMVGQTAVYLRFKVVTRVVLF